MMGILCISTFWMAEHTDIELLKMMRSVAFTKMGCSRSVCNHPFLVCILCFFIYIYRLSPFMFSLLVSASPVLVCTAVLLGALLRFGEPNIPENEVENKENHVDASVKSGESRGDTDVEQNGQYFTFKGVEKRRGASLSTIKASEIRKEGNSDVSVASIEKIGIKKHGIRKVRRKFGKMRHKKRSEWNEERTSNGEFTESDYASNPKVYGNLDSDYEKSEADSFDSESMNVDTTPCSGWQKVENQDDEEEGEDDMLDSGSEGIDSSSPGASMCDIMPVLDELHPLLDEVALQLVQISHQGSQAVSDLSRQTSISGNESDIETVEDSEAVDDDNEDKEDQSEAAITWTEEDQKNLQDLGSSEIERNQRLETLMLRRRERKFKSMVAEMNLIDLEGSDLPLNIAPIVTRRNPFDVLNDSYGNGLPPIPGSAPSVLLPRQNPFDIPCDSTEEKLHRMEGEGQLKILESKEPLFRRHRFSIGPSDFVHNRQERQNVKFRPYFVPEPLIQSSFPVFQQQSSELSDSRLSSLPETESVSSAEDTDGQRVGEEDNPKDIEVVSSTAKVTDKRSSGEGEPVPKREISEDDKSRLPKVISEDVGQGSQSSEHQSSSDLGQNDDKVPHPDDDNQLGRGSVVQHAAEAVERKYRRGSSSPSMSEASERFLNDTTCKEISTLGDGDDDLDTSRRTSAQSTVTSSPPDEVPHKEPVYDSSPPEIKKSLSSFNAFGMHSESELDLLPAIIKQTVSLVERNSDGTSQVVVEKGDSNNVEKSDKLKTSHVAVNKHEDDNNSCDSSEAGASTSNVHSHSDDKRPGLAQVRVSLSGSEAEASLSTTKEKTLTSSDSKEVTQSSTPSGSTTVFYNTATHDPSAEHLEEVQVPNTPVDSSDKMSSLPNLNIPNIHELIDSSIVDSPYTPDNPVPSSAGLRVLDPIAEETNETKEMSELDEDDDLRWTSHPTAFDKYVDSAGDAGTNRLPDADK